MDLEFFGWNTHFLCCTCSDMWLHSSISVLKYKKNDEEESLKDKLSKLNIHSISKKSKRVTNHLKILTRGEPQVIFLLRPYTSSWGVWMLIFLWGFCWLLSELFLEHWESRSLPDADSFFLPLLGEMECGWFWHYFSYGASTQEAKERKGREDRGQCGMPQTS